MNTILLLEDEENLRHGICFKLEKEGYRVIATQTIQEAKQALLHEDVQLILCDILLNGESGLTFCRYVRNELRRDLEFIFLTAMDQEIDIVMGYETGADDYITKPFHLSVLMSKVNAVFWRLERRRLRQDAGDTPVIKSGPLLCYPGEMQLVTQQGKVSLTRNEYLLLQLFFNHPGQILSKGQILSQLFDADGDFADENTVAVNIRRLREKIGDDAKKRIIKNIRGMGYVWDLEVEKLQ